MFNRRLNVLLPLCLAPLAACGGGGDDVAGIPRPPAGTVSEALPGLTGSQSFETASTTLTGTFSGPAETPSNVSTSQSGGFGNGVTLSYDANARSYTVNVNQGGISDSITYRASDIDDDPARGFIEYERDAANGDDTELTLRRPGAGGSNLSYVNYGLWEREVDQPGDADIERWAMFVYGVRTTAAQLPTTGTASYSGTLDGLWTTATASYRLSGTSALTANFGAGSVSGTLTASGRDRETGAVVTMDTLTGNGAISRADATFAGGLAGTNGFSGTWNGGFFGSSAQEVGGTFRVTRPGEQATGVFIGGQ